MPKPGPQVVAINKLTGKKVRVPPHFLDVFEHFELPSSRKTRSRKRGKPEPAPETPPEQTPDESTTEE